MIMLFIISYLCVCSLCVLCQILHVHVSIVLQLMSPLDTMGTEKSKYTQNNNIIIIVIGLTYKLYIAVNKAEIWYYNYVTFL